MLFDDNLVSDREAETDAWPDRFGGEAGIKNFAANCGVDAVAVVGDCDLDLGGVGLGGEGNPAMMGHGVIGGVELGENGVDRVVQDVEECLVNLSGVESCQLRCSDNFRVR
jgi:hypothetical protein